jgi:hypothetical protein
MSDPIRPRRNRHWRGAAVTFLALSAALVLLPRAAIAAEPAPAKTAAFEEITWLTLVPKDWKPQERLDLKRAQTLDDSDEQAQVMMKELREILDTAPTVSGLDGRRVKLPGYVVPLERTDAGMTEFLLVPYFGACIHTPPPAANQIVHVRSAKPLSDIASMSAVWVRGTLRTVRKSSGTLGVSAYQMELAAAEPYRRPTP